MYITFVKLWILILKSKNPPLSKIRAYRRSSIIQLFINFPWSTQKCFEVFEQLIICCSVVKLVAKALNFRNRMPLKWYFYHEWFLLLNVYRFENFYYPKQFLYERCICKYLILTWFYLLRFLINLCINVICLLLFQLRDVIFRDYYIS